MGLHRHRRSRWGSMSAQSRQERGFMDVTLSVSERDFEQLTQSSMEWGPHWREQAARFERMTVNYTPDALWTFGMAYWVAGGWSSVMILRAFLCARREEYEVLWDQIPNPEPGYVIVTGYRSLGWQREEG